MNVWTRTAAFFLFLSAAFAHAQPAAPAFAPGASAGAILEACRRMLPQRPVTLDGCIILRSRKGIVQGEYDYHLAMDRTLTPATLTVEIRARGRTNVLERATLQRPGPLPQGRILKTDVTWLDLTLDFLWWPHAAFETARESETIHGQLCHVILVTPEKPLPDVSAVRLWVDRKTGCLMQAEQLNGEHKAIRRLWGTRVKKFDGRWMANVLEVETLGSGHRTKITVDAFKVAP